MPKTNAEATMRRTGFIFATLATALSAMSLMTTAGSATAAEIKVLSGGALQPVMSELIPKFEQSSGHNVTIEYGGVGGMTDRIQRGEAVDVAMVSTAQIDALQKQGKVLAGSQVNFAKVGVGVFVGKGAPKPDIRSVEAFKRALLAATSVSYSDAASGAPVGIYLPGELERLGIAAAMKPKTKILRSKEQFEAVARGDIEIGLNQITEILAAPGIEFVGPLPSAIQNYTSFAAGIVANSQQTDAAKAFISFISSPAAAAAMKAKGFEAF